MAVPPLAVDSLWVEGHSAARGAGIGAALLGATFAVLMAVDCRSRAEQNPTWWFACDTGDELAVVLALSGVIGGATGAVLGGLVGWAVPRWQLRFVRPR